jgi:hypothetical protein
MTPARVPGGSSLAAARGMWRAKVLLVCVAACGGATSEELERRKPRVDAAAAPDGATTSGDSTEAGVVSCYGDGAPSSTCTLPVHCCFTNYTAAHNGYCTTSACGWGTITCDGPEDCGDGLRCCATAQTDPALGTTGYDVSCKPSCDGPPLDHELCHPAADTCASGACVSAYDHAYDLPRTLHVCL